MPKREEVETMNCEAFLNDPDTRLIAPAQDESKGVEFTFDGSWRTCRIWEGYFRASQILLEAALQEPQEARGLIFPALFNLRHAIEVALKWHIQYAGGLVPRRAGHDLGVLLTAFRETAHDLDDETSYVSDFALACISELASVDPQSITFRYSSEPDGRPIKIAPRCWDLGRLYCSADALSLWFDSLSGQIDLSRDDHYQAYLRS